MSPQRKCLTQSSLLTGAAMMGLAPPAIRQGAWGAGSDAPEKTEVKIGFIPLTDCASVVIASVMKFDEKYGIKIIPSKEASWAAVRDKLVNGEIDAAHMLYGLIYGVQMGIGGTKKDMSVLMIINNNGQGITLSNAVAKKVNQIALYNEAASQLKAPVPKEPFRTSKLIDGVVWDAKDPKKYAGGFSVKA